MTDQQSHYGVAWAFNGHGGVSPDTCRQRLENALDGAIASHVDPSSATIMGGSAFWRAGRRVAESVQWMAVGAPVPLRQSHARVVNHWTMRDRAGELCSMDAALPWPRVAFLGMVSSKEVIAQVSGPSASCVALEKWQDSLVAQPSAPPWVNAALWGDMPLLEEELGQAIWTRAAGKQWWDLVSSMVSTRPQDPTHYEVSSIDGRLAVHRLPISDPAVRSQVLVLLARHLPVELRRPSRLASVDKKRRHVFPAFDTGVVDKMLRPWVSPDRFWSLRRSLALPLLTESYSKSVLADFMALPAPAAHRALDKMAQSSRDFWGTQKLNALPVLHAHAPAWPGWRSLLEDLEPKGVLAPPSLSFLASLRATALADALPSASQTISSAARPRL